MEASVNWDEEDESVNINTARRKRRRARSILKNGKSSVRAHKEIAGRTGQVWGKKTKSSKALKFIRALINFPFPTQRGIE